MIVHSLDPIMIVGGSTVDRSDLNKSLTIAPIVVAADGGARHLMADGPVPAAVIGDFDSLPDDARARFRDQLHQVVEQDTTDFEKVLDRVSAPLIIGLGFLGGRVDHNFAALNLLARRDDPVILFGEQDIVMRLPADFHVTLPKGALLALLPMGAAQVWTTGLKWDLQGSDLAPDGAISSSNQVVGPEVRIKATGPVLLSLAKDQLDVATAAVRAQRYKAPRRW